MATALLLQGCSSSRPQDNSAASVSTPASRTAAPNENSVQTEASSSSAAIVPDAVDSLLQLKGPPSEDVAHESYLRGLQLLQQGQPQLAELFYKRALANSPHNRFLAFQLAEILAEQEKSAEALKIARSGVKYPGESNSSEFHLLARLYRENSEIDSAKAYYRKAIESNDQNLRALYEYSLLLEILQEYNELSRVYDMLLPLLDYPRSMIEKQLLLYRLNQNDSAMVELLQVAFQTQGDPDYARLLAEVLEAQGKNTDAQAIVVQTLDKFPEDRDSWNSLVRLQLRAGQLEEARRSQSRLFYLDTTQTDVLQRLAMLEYDVGRADSAGSHFRRLLRLDSTDHVAHFFLSHLAQISGDTSRALLHIRASIALRPDALPYRNQLGAIYYLSGNYVRAHEVFDSTLSMSAHPLPMQLKANAYTHEASRVGSTSPERSRQLRLSALEWMLKAYALDSNAVDLQFDIASNYERLDSLDQSINWFSRLLGRDPRSHAALNYLGYLLVDSQRDVARGVLLIDSALALDPDNLSYLDSRGWALYRLGRFSEALQVMEGIEAKGMEDATLWEHLALICEALNMPDRAKSYWERLLKLNPRDATALQRTGGVP